MTLIRPEEWTPQGVDDLEDRAWQALRETIRSVCVTAGAGAGKTEFLAQKATYLLQTGLCADPKRILAISFKRDAAQTLADRVRQRCPEAQARRFISLTFDAFTKSLVDQFRLALPELHRPPTDYEISFPTNPILNDFLQRHDFNDINIANLTRLISGIRILDQSQIISNRQRQVWNAYWLDQYHGAGHTYLTFPMINRLAEYLLRNNLRIRRAIRATYPVVFLDEFQDATTSQFELVTTAFDPESAVITAVGDDKQKIMGWAGAMQNAFQLFADHFDAKCITLLLNWRSHADLVAIQHTIATRIDPTVEPAIARGAREVDGDIAAIWTFESQESEAATLAKWIRAEVDKGVKAHEIAVLVRNHANDTEDELAPALVDENLVLRNLARNLGEIAIQDLLSENLTDILLPFLRLGSVKRDPNAWSQAQEILRSLEAPFEGDEVALQRISAKAEAIAKASRSFMRANAVDSVRARPIVALLVQMIGEASIRQSTHSYRRQADFDRVREGFTVLLEESLSEGESWASGLDRFEGKDQVPLMTIHKSKGMEFHTIIFFGLDNQTWWSLTPNRQEELNSFFVAFTRAKQRAFFTFCQARGGRIAWLEDLLGTAVPRLVGELIA